ncbi:MFS transporter [Blastococcus sp. SYSU D00922]
MDRFARARNGTWLCFLVTGLLSATWASRIPAVQDRLDLDEAGLAVVVLGIEGGALVGLPLGAAVVARVGSPAALRAALLLFAPGLVAAAAAPGVGVLVPAVAVWAAANSVIDVALNAQGVELDRRNGRPVLAALHAGQSAGLVLGAVAGTVAAAAGLPLPWHAAVVACAGLVLGLLGARAAVREPAPRGPRRSVRPQRRLLVLGAIAFCAFLVDGAAMNWMAVHLGTAHGAGPGLAAAGYLGLTLAMVAGRLPADRVVEKFSRRRVTEGCATGMALGAALVVLAPSTAVAVCGWLVLGLFLAPVTPTVLGAAPAVSGAPSAAALSAVTTVGYLGSFTGPPAIGLLADAWGLTAALALLLGASLAIGLLARAALGRA